MSNFDKLEFLRKQFFCCTPLNKFKWPDLLMGADETLQKQIIDATVNSEIVLKYPVKRSYIKTFLKILMQKLEKNGLEIVEEIFTAYCDNLSLPDDDSMMCYKHFLLDYKGKSKLLSIKESSNIISQGTTGLCSWKAAFYLAEWCIFNKDQVFGKNILELGSGIGLTGLTVIHFCEPKTYYFSDCHPAVLKTLEENIRLNLLKKLEIISWKEIPSNDYLQLENITEKTQVNIKSLNWGEIDSKENKMPLDIVIAADILYDSTNFDSLASALKILLNNTCKYAIIAATVRNESTIEKFLNLIRKYDLYFKEETPLTPEIFLEFEETPVKILKIYKINPQQRGLVKDKLQILKHIKLFHRNN